MHICTFAHLHISQINARLHISGQKEVCKILQDLQKVCKNLQDLQIFFAKFLANFEFFKNFSRSCCRFFSKIRQRDDRCSSSKIFKFTTENFLIFHIFEKKNCWSFSTSNYLLCEAPLCKTIYHGGPKISEAPPGSPDEGGIWCIFANFSEFLDIFWKFFEVLRNFQNFWKMSWIFFGIFRNSLKMF